jgi:hypothetical protein
MLKVPRRYVDIFNIVLILATCALAHYFPYHLLVASYAVLGPAHYLTQISWLHDRNYFAHSRLLAPAITICAVILVMLFFYTGNGSGALCCAVFALALGLAAVSIIPPDNIALRCMAGLAGLLLCLIAFLSPTTALLISAFLPTILHIFVFTAAFMWVGAVKSGKIAAYLAVVVLLVCAATFFIPTLTKTVPDLTGLAFFRPLVVLMQNFLGMSQTTETQLFGFLSFAYTYHYLNWFSKADVINWHQIPRQRMLIIVLIYAGTIAAYVYNYAVGYLLILLLAHLHVMLEFPLNMRTFAVLAGRRG